MGISLLGNSRQLCTKIYEMKNLFLCAFLAAASFGFAQPVPVGPDFGMVNNWNEERIATKRITLNTGVTLEYAEQGVPEGIPVILLHGVTDSWHSFATTLPYLPGNLHVFALSQRGHGNSDRPGQGYSAAHFAADVADFIRKKKLERVILVGHSMGGMVAQQFAINYPQLLKGLVIICSDPAVSKNPGIPEFVQEVMKMEGEPDRQFLTGFQQGTLANPIDTAYFNLLVNESMKLPVPIFKEIVLGMSRMDITTDLKKIAVPVLVLWGEKDAFFMREGQQALIKNIPDAVFVEYKETGHALHWEQPGRFSMDLVKFVENTTWPKDPK